MSMLFEQVYNPDILNCLANLSNDEVFTPPEVVNNMLDMLPQELFESPDTTFLDPACKTGVFLREIAKRLLRGLKDIIPDENERRRHIFTKQLFGIAITELTSLLSRRSLYCSKYANTIYSIVPFDGVEGNIRFKNMEHYWEGNRCGFCGASKSQYDREEGLEQYAYEFIHTNKPEEIWSMKWDCIISNPPYALSDGGAGPSAVPLYHRFVEQAIKLNPRYVAMIIPARWYAGGRGLDDFRNKMLSSKKLSSIIDYESSKDCFPGVDVAGGICYFLWDRDHNGNCKVANMVGNQEFEDNRDLDEFPIFIRSNQAVRILRKVLSLENSFLNSLVLTQKPFGFRTYARGEKNPFKGAVQLISSEGVGYVNREEITKNEDLVDKYKVIVGRLVPSNGELDIKPGEGYRVITPTRILGPSIINTESYVTLGTFDTENEAENYAYYLSQKFPRFLLKQAISSVNINREVFRFVPKQDFTKKWSDAELYQKYDLSSDEIEYIESLIRSME